MIHSAVKEILSLSTPSAHASCIARVNGETWLTWFGGSSEGQDDVKIYFSRQTASGWTEPIRISADEALPHWNPVLLPRGDGADLFFKIGTPIPAWRTMRVHIGADGLPTGEIRELVPGDIGGRGPVRNKCLTLRNGLLLAPASIEHKEPHAWREYLNPAALSSIPSPDPALRWRPFVDISEDGGETFTKVVPVPLFAFREENSSSPAETAAAAVISLAKSAVAAAKAASPIEKSTSPAEDPAAPLPCDGNARPLSPCFVRRAGAIQPALWQSDDGSVHMLLRSSEGYILRSDSPDGLAWSPARLTSLPNNNSGIDLVRLDDGRILLCLNPVPGDWAARTPLWLYLSQDDGDSFSPLMALEVNPGEYSYPSLACEGNTVYLSYTWKRETIAAWEIELEPRA